MYLVKMAPDISGLRSVQKGAMMGIDGKPVESLLAILLLVHGGLSKPVLGSSKLM
jgi:hypothetical protein